ncbi:MAG: hypothetical protein Q9228_003452 [Teloschistes exilis]
MIQGLNSHSLEIGAPYECFWSRTLEPDRVSSLAESFSRAEHMQLLELNREIIREPDNLDWLAPLCGLVGLRSSDSSSDSTRRDNRLTTKNFEGFLASKIFAGHSAAKWSLRTPRRHSYHETLCHANTSKPPFFPMAMDVPRRWISIQPDPGKTKSIAKTGLLTNAATSSSSSARRCLPNPRIINLHSALTSSTNIQLYLEYCDGGDLASLVRKSHHRYNYETGEWEYYRIPESFIQHIFLQVAEALAYIHHGRDYRDPKTQLPEKDWLSVVYRDIEPHNVLLRRNSASNNPAHAAAYDKEPYSNINLADSGMAISAQLPGIEPTSSRRCGTERYQPPEKPHHS